MKKNIYTIALGIFGIFMLTTSVSAASTFSFSPASVRVRAGETFTVRIAVDPQGIKNYTVKTEISFPADLVKVDTFTFGNNWLPLSQPGYDAIDNGTGVLVKTAGYAAGISTSATFGTISFTAKKDGSGIIKTTGNSLALDAGNQNALNGSTIQLPIVIEKLAEQTAPPKTEGLTPETPKIEEATSSAETGGVVEKETTESASLLASIGNVISFGTNKIWAAFVAGAIISSLLIGLIMCFMRRLRRKKTGKI